MSKLRKLPTSLLFVFFFLFFISLPSFAATIIYEYDALNRLHTVNYGNGFLETYDYDATGNRTSLNVADIVSPTGTITSTQITLINGNATISGTASDLGSGIQTVEISFDGGQTWQTVTTHASDWSTWSYTWATTPGIYEVRVRVTDNGGNTQVSSHAITILPTLYASFTGYGLWKHDGTAWTQLAPENPENIAASGSFLYGDFGNSGIWMWNGNAWSRLAPENPDSMAVSY
jgi:YD repeat-containing protein